MAAPGLRGFEKEGVWGAGAYNFKRNPVRAFTVFRLTKGKIDRKELFEKRFAISD